MLRSHVNAVSRDTNAETLRLAFFSLESSDIRLLGNCLFICLHSDHSVHYAICRPITLMDKSRKDNSSCNNAKTFRPHICEWAHTLDLCVRIHAGEDGNTPKTQGLIRSHVCWTLHKRIPSSYSSVMCFLGQQNVNIRFDAWGQIVYQMMKPQ